MKSNKIKKEREKLTRSAQTDIEEFIFFQKVESLVSKSKNISPLSYVVNLAVVIMRILEPFEDEVATKDIMKHIREIISISNKRIKKESNHDN
jgi:hypothetical protein